MREATRSRQFGSAEQYFRAFSELDGHGRITRNQRRLLCSHYAAPHHTATRKDLAKAVGYSSGRIVNMQYGSLAHRIATRLRINKPPTASHFVGGWWGYVLEDIAQTSGTQGDTAYVLRPAVIAAIERLGWVNGASAVKQQKKVNPRAEPAQAERSERLPSGNEHPDRTDVLVSRTLRDSAIARRLKALYRDTCQRCGTRLELAQTVAYSEVHHLKPLGAPHGGPDVGSNILVVCPNCHVLLDHGQVALKRSELNIHPQHGLSETFVRYHNKLVLARGMPPNTACTRRRLLNPEAPRVMR